MRSIAKAFAYKPNSKLCEENTRSENEAIARERRKGRRGREKCTKESESCRVHEHLSLVKFFLQIEEYISPWTKQIGIGFSHSF
jgi:hypothetical protein